MAHFAGVRSFKIFTVDPEDQSFGGCQVQIYKPYSSIFVREHVACRSTKMDRNGSGQK